MQQQQASNGSTCFRRRTFRCICVRASHNARATPHCTLWPALPLCAPPLALWPCDMRASRGSPLVGAPLPPPTRARAPPETEMVLRYAKVSSRTANDHNLRQGGSARAAARPAHTRNKTNPCKWMPPTGAAPDCCVGAPAWRRGPPGRQNMPHTGAPANKARTKLARPGGSSPGREVHTAGHCGAHCVCVCSCVVDRQMTARHSMRPRRATCGPNHSPPIGAAIERDKRAPDAPHKSSAHSLMAVRGPIGWLHFIGPLIGPARAGRI